jgi:hypothetical protein
LIVYAYFIHEFTANRRQPLKPATTYTSKSGGYMHIGAGTSYTADTAIAVPFFGMIRQPIHFAVPDFRLRASIFST